MFLLSVCECERHKGENITKISMKEKGEIGNVKRSWLKNRPKIGIKIASNDSSSGEECPLNDGQFDHGLPPTYQ